MILEVDVLSQFLGWGVPGHASEACLARYVITGFADKCSA